MSAITGTIKQLLSQKGFGFVAAQDGSEYFFHRSACVETRFEDLHEGQAVTLEKGQGPNGPRAENVRPVKAVDAPTLCPACGSTNTMTASKTIDASSYWRCGSCGEVWNVARRPAGRRHDVDLS